MRILKIMALVTALAGCFFQAGCSSLGVQPWQRSALAKPQMSWNYCQLTLAIDDHVYFSKEAMSGGRDFAGGGCGCN